MYDNIEERPDDVFERYLEWRDENYTESEITNCECKSFDEWFEDLDYSDLFE